MCSAAGPGVKARLRNLRTFQSRFPPLLGTTLRFALCRLLTSCESVKRIDLCYPLGSKLERRRCAVSAVFARPRRVAHYAARDTFRVSDEPYGWVVYHYGRWVWTDRWGWMWVAGYDWAPPAWVEWCYGGGLRRLGADGARSLLARRLLLRHL